MTSRKYPIGLLLLILGGVNLSCSETPKDTPNEQTEQEGLPGTVPVVGPDIQEFDGKYKLWIPVFDEGSLVFTCADFDAIVDGTADCSDLEESGATIVGLPVTIKVFTNEANENHLTAELETDLDHIRGSINQLHENGFYVLLMIDTIFYSDVDGVEQNGGGTATEDMATSDDYRKSIRDIILDVADIAQEFQVFGISPISEPEKTFYNVTYANEFYSEVLDSGGTILDEIRDVYSYGKLYRVEMAQAVTQELEPGVLPDLTGFDMFGINYSPEGSQMTVNQFTAKFDDILDALEVLCDSNPTVDCMIDQSGVWGGAATDGLWTETDNALLAYSYGYEAVSQRSWLKGWGPFDGTDDAPFAVQNVEGAQAAIKDFFDSY